MKKTPKSNFTGGLSRPGSLTGEEFARAFPRPGGGLGEAPGPRWNCGFCGYSCPQGEHADHACAGSKAAAEIDRRWRENIAAENAKPTTCIDCRGEMVPGIQHRCAVSGIVDVNVAEGLRLARQLRRAGYEVTKTEDGAS